MSQAEQIVNLSSMLEYCTKQKNQLVQDQHYELAEKFRTMVANLVELIHYVPEGEKELSNEENEKLIVEGLAVEQYSISSIKKR